MCSRQCPPVAIYYQVFALTKFSMLNCSHVDAHIICDLTVVHLFKCIFNLGSRAVITLRAPGYLNQALTWCCIVERLWPQGSGVKSRPPSPSKGFGVTSLKDFGVTSNSSWKHIWRYMVGKPCQLWLYFPCQ